MMTLALQTVCLFRTAKTNLIQHTIKRGFISSWKKGISRDTIIWLQQPIDLSPSGIRRWLKKKQWQALIEEHRYKPERHQILGPDLATAHFVVARDGEVQFEGFDGWRKKNVDGKYYLPSSSRVNLRLEAVNVSNTNMMYTSFDNFVNLHHLKYLDVSNCPYIDDWCLDRFVQFRNSLLVLNLSGCPQVTERGLSCLHRLHNLKRLILYDMPSIKDHGMIALLLEEAMPNCIVEGIDYTTMDFHEKVDDQIPNFLHQYEEFAWQKEREKMKAAARDGILDIVENKDKRLNS